MRLVWVLHVVVVHTGANPPGCDANTLDWATWSGSQSFCAGLCRHIPISR